MRSLVILSIFAISIFSSRKAHAGGPDLDAAPLHIDFKVESPNAKSPLAQGAIEAEPEEMTKFGFDDSEAHTKVHLELFARPHHDGTVAVWLEYEEETAGKLSVKWQPAIQGKRGTPLIATIRAGDVVRTATVTVK